MPILIVLKNPRMNLIANEDLKDESEQKWDEIFHNQVLIVKNQAGRNTLIPLLQECNIAVIEEVTDKEVKEMEERAEKKRKQAEAQGGKGGLISRPEFMIPSDRGGRG